MAKAKQIMGGLMLAPTTEFGDRERKRCRSLVAPSRARRNKEPNPGNGLKRLAGADRCRHCRSRKAEMDRRGLCQPCHAVEAVRVMYPPAGGYGAAGAANAAASAVILPDRPAERPTYCRPGTVGKFLALCERYATGQTLWHPNDARA